MMCVSNDNQCNITMQLHRHIGSIFVIAMLVIAMNSLVFTIS
jgi:hypothetical protein